MKWKGICLMRFLESDQKNNGREVIFRETVAENFSELKEGMSSQGERAFALRTEQKKIRINLYMDRPCIEN